MKNALMELSTSVGFLVLLAIALTTIHMIYCWVKDKINNRVSKSKYNNLYRIIKAMNSLHKLDERLIGRTCEGEWIEIIAIDLQERREVR